jgi:hypothetical protein
MLPVITFTHQMGILAIRDAPDIRSDNPAFSDIQPDTGTGFDLSDIRPDTGYGTTNSRIFG